MFQVLFAFFAVPNEFLELFPKMTDDYNKHQSSQGKFAMSSLVLSHWQWTVGNSTQAWGTKSCPRIRSVALTAPSHRINLDHESTLCLWLIDI